MKNKVPFVVGLGLAGAGAYLLARKAGAVEFPCPYCGEVFGTAEELATHVELFHPEEPEPEPEPEPEEKPFVFGLPSMQMVSCESATAWNTANYQIALSNPYSHPVTRVITMWGQGYDVDDNEWGTPREIVSAGHRLKWEITLQPGETKILDIKGNFYDKEDHRWRCYILIARRYRFYMWAKDDLGNESEKAYVTRS